MKLPIETIKSLNKAFGDAEARLATEAAAAMERVRALSAQLDETVHRADALQQANDDLQSKLDMLRQAISAREDEISRLRFEVTDGDAEIAELLNKLEAIESAHADLGTQLASARQAQADAERQFADHAARAAEQAAWLTQALASASAKDEQIRDLQQSASQAQAAAVQLEQQVLALQARHREMLAEHAEERDREIELLRQAAAQAQAQGDAHAARLEQQLRSMEDRHQEALAARVGAKDEEIRALQQSVAQAQKTAALLEERLQSLGSQYETLQALHAGEVARAASQADAHARTVELLVNAQAKAAEALRTEHTAALDLLRNNHAAALELVRDDHALAVGSLRDALRSASEQTQAARSAQARVEAQLAEALQSFAHAQTDLAAERSELERTQVHLAQARAAAERLERERDQLALAVQTSDARWALTQQSLEGLRLLHDEARVLAADLTARLDEERAAQGQLRQQAGDLQRRLDESARQASEAALSAARLAETLQAGLADAQAQAASHAAEGRRLRADLERIQGSRLWPLIRWATSSPAKRAASGVPAAMASLHSMSAAAFLPSPPPHEPPTHGDDELAASEPPMNTNNTLTAHNQGSPAAGDSLETLLARHDLDFVEAAYRAILRRPADPAGRDFYLGRLRAGAPKLQLLVELNESPEARRAGPPLAGLHAASRRLRWARVPVLGRLFRMLVGTESAAETQARLRAIEQQIARVARQDALALERIQRGVGEAATQLQSLRVADGIARPTPRGRAPAPVFFTICSKNFTAYARTLHESLTRHHPGAAFYMFLCDGPDERFDPASLPFTVVTLAQLDIPDPQGMAERYNITEFNTAIKPFAFQYLFKIKDAQEVVYLDPDIYVTSPLQEVVDGFRDGADCILTPHILNPAEGAEVSDDKLLLFGIYNLGFIALRNTPRVTQIVEWWGRRLERECIIALEKGLFVDQKWADLFPAFIPHTLVLRHAGYNVAYWNVPQRKITRQAAGWMANDEPLRFAHFSGNKLDDPAVYSRHSWTLNTGNIGELKALLDIYRDAVYANGHAQYLKLPYAYNWNGSSGVNLHTPKPAHEVDGTARVPETSEPARDAQPAAAEVPAVPTAALPTDGLAVESAGDTGVAAEPGAPLPRLFVTDWSTPRPDQDAGSVTTFFLLKILVNLGYDVTFVPSDLEPLGSYTDAVRKLGVLCLHRDEIGTVAEYLAREGASFDAFILFRAPIAALYLADIRRAAPRAKVVLETVDLHYLRDERAAQADGSPAAIEQARLAKAWELGIIKDCDVSIVLSSFEQELLEREVPGADIRTMPLLFLDMPGPSGRGFRERANMLFIGGFRHLPNVDAVTWFCRDIWPRVHQRLPEARFQIVGSHPPQEVLDLAAVPGVDVLGHVKDLAPVFDQVRLSVTPLRFGAGIKGKVATSLGYGVPVVGTGLTFEGMELRHERHVLVADDAEAFVEQVVRGYTDEALWTRMSRDGFDRVEALYSESAGRTRVEALMDSLALKSSDFQFHTFRTQSQYIAHRRQFSGEYQRRQRAEIELIERGVDSFFVKGWCAVCACPTDFQVGFMYSYQSTDDGLPIPNWREHLNCMKCGHTTRVRLMVHLIDHYLRPAPAARIYISEQTTPLYRHLQQHHGDVTGSEYLGSRVALGGHTDGMRNEDLTQLTFQASSFDLMISCDVLEHVTDDNAAFAECFRCLAPGGRLMFTAPCSLDSASNIIRARMTDRGDIEHLITPPEYHGNPVDPENGALCFRYFGWEILDQLRRAGFTDAYVLSAWSQSLGYLGVEQIVFVAEKAA